jgi:hypothetical protein
MELHGHTTASTCTPRSEEGHWSIIRCFVGPTCRAARLCAPKMGDRDGMARGRGIAPQRRRAAHHGAPRVFAVRGGPYVPFGGEASQAHASASRQATRSCRPFALARSPARNEHAWNDAFAFCKFVMTRVSRLTSIIDILTHRGHVDEFCSH